MRKQLLFYCLPILLLLSQKSAVYAQVTAGLSLLQTSPYLSDYGDAYVNNLQLILTYADGGTNPYIDVKLKLEITSDAISMTTNAIGFATQMPIRLYNNQTEILTDADLYTLFTPENLQLAGIALDDLGNPLPENAYLFCITAVKTTSIVAAVSPPACVPVNTALYAPPIITFPIDGQTLTVAEPPSFLFTWFCNQAPVLMADYTLELWTTIDGISNAEVVNNYAPYMSVMSTNSLPSYNYSAVDPPLEIGSEYLARVSISGAESAYFDNNGHSEIISFTLAEGAPPLTCDPPMNATISIVNTNKLNTEWLPPNTGNPATGYTFQWKGVNNDPQDWQIEPTLPAATNNAFLLENLTLGHTYQAQIRTQCTEEVSDWVDIQKTLPPEEEEITEVDCGAPLQQFPIDNQTPLPTLASNETFQAGDFEITVTQVSGSNGLFFGKGYIDVPYFNGAQVNVKYNGININDQRYLYNGEVVVTGAGVNLLGDELANALNDILTTLETIDEILAAAETILQAIDDIIAQVEPYLPPGIIQGLLDAQAALAAAQQQYDAAETAGTSTVDAEAALQSAQTQLAAANSAYQAALAAFLQQFAEVVIALVQDLLQDCVFSNLEGDFEQKKTQLDNYLATYNTGVVDAINVPTLNTPNVGYQDGFSEIWFDDLPDEELIIDENFTTTSDTYYDIEMSYMLCITIDKINNIINQPNKANQLSEILKSVDFDLLNAIGTKIKAGETTPNIVYTVKSEVAEALQDLLKKINYSID